MASHRTSWLPWFLLLVVLGAAGTFFYLRKLRQGERATYLTAEVTIGDLTQAVTATGTLNPVLNVQVGSQISGIIYKLNADFNTQVKKGQVVAQIDPATYQAEVSVAQGDLAAARASLELANLTASRTQKLLASRSASPSELDAAIAGLHQAQAQVKIKEGAVERAQIDLERCTIYAPTDGIVISRSVDVGQTVAASLSAPILFTIANDLTKMQIDANVAEADVGQVAVNQKVDFSVDAFPYRTFHGVVKQVRNAPLIVQNVVTYDTVISVDNAELKLKPGMTANVSVFIADRTAVLKLPNAALRIRLEDEPAGKTGAAVQTPTPALLTGPPGGKARPGGKKRAQNVYVLEGKTPQMREVQLGISDGISSEVVSGLKEGERVVISVIERKKPRSDAPANPFSGNQRPR